MLCRAMSSVLELVSERTRTFDWDPDSHFLTIFIILAMKWTHTSLAHNVTCEKPVSRGR